MIENIVNAVFDGEMDAHLTQESRESGNRRYGKMQKQVQTPAGDITVTTLRDRDASFDPSLYFLL
jgi:transposase-like protein